MEQLVFVLASLAVLSGGLVFLGQRLKDYEVQNIIRRSCDNLGFYSKRSGSFVSLSPFHPNNICYIRAVLAWIGIAFYYFGNEYLGIELYLVAVFLDAVDGMVARACGLVTEKGKKIDPLYDKATYLPVIFFLFFGLASAYVFLFFEIVGQFVVRKILAYQGRSGAANNFGKIKALFAFSLMPYVFVVQNYDAIPDISSNLMVVCAVLSACSAIFKLIPNRHYANILSLLNLACGITGIVLILNGALISVALVILLGQVFDFFDGRAAVKHGGTPMGVWLDDGADLVSFGICPALMVWKIGDSMWLDMAAAIFLSSILFRLLRFVLVDKKREGVQEYIFFGLPSPAGATIVMGSCLASQEVMNIWIAVILASVLSVSKYKFIHLGRGIAKQAPKAIIVIGSAALLVCLAYLVRIDSQTGIGYFMLMGILLYMTMSELIKKKLISD